MRRAPSYSQTDRGWKTTSSKQNLITSLKMSRETDAKEPGGRMHSGTICCGTTVVHGNINTLQDFDGTSHARWNQQGPDRSNES
eukprot:scaffold2574_cov98-Cylindrotheca_fusiformis.AAC.4